MKKVTIILLVMLLAISVVGCGSAVSFTEQDLVFVYDGEDYALDSDSTKLVTALGQKYSFSEAVSCAYKGMDKIFAYEGIDIYTYPLDDLDRIDEIYITSNQFATKKGITVGSTLADIKTAYGKDAIDIDGDGLLVLTLDGPSVDTNKPCIYFVMDGDKVLEFSFYSASNRQ